MAHEFEELALYGHNYSTWAMNVKISLTFRGMYEVIIPQVAGVASYTSI
jgi:hypothetical protein